jgi:hypothetical protein
MVKIKYTLVLPSTRSAWRVSYANVYTTTTFLGFSFDLRAVVNSIYPLCLRCVVHWPEISFAAEDLFFFLSKFSVYVKTEMCHSDFLRLFLWDFFFWHNCHNCCPAVRNTAVVRARRLMRCSSSCLRLSGLHSFCPESFLLFLSGTASFITQLTESLQECPYCLRIIKRRISTQL